MPLDLAAVGVRSGATQIPITWRDAVLYAIAVGAGPDELDYVYEGRGPRVLPTFWTAIAFQASAGLLCRVGAPESAAVLGECSVRMAPGATSGWPGDLVTVDGHIDAIYAIGGLGIAELRFRISSSEHDLAEVRFQMYYPGEAPTQAPRPPRAARLLAPTREADWQRALTTRPEQALLYRLCGDANPLHADPAAALAQAGITQGRPILHGLCTLGFVGRAVALSTGRPITSLSARFSRPVWPGDTLVIEGWDSGGGTVLRVRTRENPDEDVLSAAIATHRS